MTVYDKRRACETFRRNSLRKGGQIYYTRIHGNGVDNTKYPSDAFLSVHSAKQPGDLSFNAII